MQIDQELDFSSTLVIGQVEPVGGMEETGYAIFIDGDKTNFSQANVIDYEYFDNVYSYSDFLQDKLLLDQFCSIIDQQTHDLNQVKKHLQRFQDQISLLINKLSETKK
jgi:hypothetical protein